MRALSATLLAITLTVTGIAAASAQSLPAGKPAGVQHAQMVNSNSLWILGGVGAFAATFAVVAASQGNTNAPVSTTGTP